MTDNEFDAPLDCSSYESCTTEAYMQGREDREEELESAFKSLYSSELSWEEVLERDAWLKGVKEE